MAEDNEATTTESQEPDYKALYEQARAEARKWEGRAKANKDKADRLDAMAGDAATVEERIAALEAQNQAMRDAEQRRALVSKVASETGVPETIVGSLSATDEESLTQAARAIADAFKAPGGAPSAPEAGKFPHEAGSKNTAQQFGDLIDQMLG